MRVVLVIVLGGVAVAVEEAGRETETVKAYGGLVFLALLYLAA